MSAIDTIHTTITNTLTESLGEAIESEQLAQLSSLLFSAVEQEIKKTLIPTTLPVKTSQSVEKPKKKKQAHSRISLCLSRYAAARKNNDEEFLQHVFPLTVPEVAPQIAGKAVKYFWTERYAPFIGEYQNITDFLTACTTHKITNSMQQNALVYCCMKDSVRDTFFPIIEKKK